MKACLLSAAACLLTATASADEVLWYGGDIDNENGLPSGYGFDIDSNVYDDFDVVGRPIEVTALFGHFGLIKFGGFQVGDVQYEIRSGMSAGNGGSVLAQGVIGASQIDRGEWGEGNYYQITTDPISVILLPGTYWMSIAPINAEPTYALTTRGLNGVGTPIGNGNAFWNAPEFGIYFVAVDEYFGGDRNWDFSYGIIGSPVPAPAAFLVLFAGLVFRRRAASRH